MKSRKIFAIFHRINYKSSEITEIQMGKTVIPMDEKRHDPT